MIHKAKKSLGQNFLKSISVLNRIVGAGEVSKDDIILEIGPGKGILTEKLLEKSNHVIAIEKDRELFDFLQNKFSKEIKNKKLILINDDILKFNFPKMDCEFFGNYKIIANIPYNITGAILKKFLSEKNKPESMTLMIQKEVAERIMARDGKESLLSISVKAYGEPKILFRVSRGNFYPPPKVDSAVITIKNISRKLFIENNVDEDRFWEIIRTGFAHKRKKLSSNLKNIYDPLSISPLARGEKAPKTRGVGGLKDLKNKRAEELTLKDWIDIAKML